MPTTVAGHVAARLAEAGVRHAFGIPGGEVLALVDALDKAGIAFHLVKHETPGGFMADAVAQLTRTPAVLVATLGPGVSNLVTAVAHAQLDRTPMLVLTACIDPGAAATYTHQVFDHGAVLRPVTKASFTLGAAGAAALIDRAMLLATADPPGPVHLDVPTRVASLPVEAPAATLPRRARVSLAPSAELDTLVGWIARAERPLVLAGLGVLHHGAHAELRTFVQRAGAAVITTYKAKGVIPEDDPGVIGGAGLSPVADRALFKALHAADLVLALGYDPVEMRDSWIQPWPAETDSAEIGGVAKDHQVHRTKLEFVADLRLALDRLAALIPSRAGSTWLDGTPAAVRTEIAEALRPRGPWGPHAVVETCRRVFPRETLATVDTGAHRILLSQVWSCHEPYGLLQSTGLATMGYGLPAAIGAKLVRPERPVVCFTGDGSLEMVIGDLATLRDLRRPLTLVVFADRSLALIELKQRRLGLPNLGVDAPATDFVGIARAYGGHGVRVTSAPELERACREALTRETFTLIEAVVDKAEYAQQM
ncbi:MAG TPA: thiamine pyrophosphate-binding protein [Methylomirabilota bacterium]|jgi:acetolactate synthase-1/2/3 large subunit|nr:thiamine pyrophosphate-binding protein [Methylomirabilota bacterium]